MRGFKNDRKNNNLFKSGEFAVGSWREKVTGQNVTALIMLRKGKYPMEPWDLKVKTRMRKLPKGRENPNDQAVTDFVFE